LKIIKLKKNKSIKNLKKKKEKKEEGWLMGHHGSGRPPYFGHARVGTTVNITIEH